MSQLIMVTEELEIGEGARGRKTERQRKAERDIESERQRERDR